MNCAKKEFNEAKLHGYPCALLLMDIDQFKAINDRVGHAAGDVVLVDLAERCSRILRMVDVFGRIGGEEFVVFMPHATEEQAREVAERIRKAIDETAFKAGERALGVTISIGGAALGLGTDTLESLYRQAEDALYAAKRCGRNCVRF